MSILMMLVATTSSPLAAQAVAKVGAAPLAFPVRAAAVGRRAASSEAICDGSEVRSARRRGALGVGVVAAGLPVALLGMYRTVHSSSHPEAPVAIGVGAGAGLAILGFAIAATAHPNESFWQSAIDRMRPGETRSEDVRTCLQQPIAMASTDSSEEWTYLTNQGLSGRIKTVRLTFRDSVLVGIRRAEVDATLVHDLARTVPVP